MSIADATSLVATPLAFVVWGIVWALPRDLDSEGKVRGSRWTEPRLVVGLVAVVVALTSLTLDVLGPAVLRAALLAVVPFLIGFAFGRKIRSAPSFGAQGDE